MTDEQIIKAINRCLAQDCRRCEFDLKCNDVFEKAVDLINRQKDEIIQLKHEFEIVKSTNLNEFRNLMSEIENKMETKGE